MRFGIVTRGAVLTAALGLTLTACGGLDGDPTAQEATPARSTLVQPTARESTAATTTARSATTGDQPQSPEDTGDPMATPPDPTGSAPAQTTKPVSDSAADRPGSGHGLCFDLNSQLAQDAIATLGTDSNGGSWEPEGASNHPLSAGCGLDWMLVNGSGFNDATYTSRVLLFAGGKYLGTVEPHEFPYTSIAGDTLNSVTVKYRWLGKDDPFCCPQGGPSTVTVTLSGGEISRTGQFPPET